MKRYEVFLLFLASLILSDVWASDFCSQYNCPNGFKETTVCFVDSGVNEVAIDRAAKHANCGYFSDKFIIDSMSDYSKAFSSIAQNCQKIRTLRFEGHGGPNYQSAGPINRKKVNDLAKFSCTMAAGAHIDLMGCNTGRGCLGQMFMYRLAEALLPRGGTMSAATFYTSTFLPGIIPHFSLNGMDRTLDFSPNREPKDKWGYNGSNTPFGSTPNETCADTLGQKVDEYNRTKKEASISWPQCSPRKEVDYKLNMLQDSIKNIQTSDTSSLINDWERGDRVGDLVYDLDYEILRVERCLTDVRKKAARGNPFRVKSGGATQ